MRCGVPATAQVGDHERRCVRALFTLSFSVPFTHALAVAVPLTLGLLYLPLFVQLIGVRCSKAQTKHATRFGCHAKGMV